MGSTPIKTSYSASPEVSDLDGDGKKDLVVSDYSGFVMYYRNTGEDSSPVFTNSERLMAGSTHMKVGGYGRLDAVDWDEDGDIDILMRESDAYVNLFLNTTISSAVTDNSSELPSGFYLGQNFPNPFNASTTISYQLAEPTVVRLSVYNLSGQLIDELVNEQQVSGYYSISWTALKQKSGIYFFKLSAGEFTFTKKCILQK